MSEARVIGAGLSGLVAAWHLAERGLAVTVTEKAPSPGGLIQTRRTPYGLIETAANAFVWDDAVDRWFRQLGLRPEFPRPESRRRFVLRDGRPRRWPLAPLESLGAAARLARSAVTRSLASRDEESVAAWGERVVGPAATRWLLEPAMQGVYAAPASELSARVIFGARRKGKRRLATPADGMGGFIARLHERLRDRGVRFEFNVRATTIDAGCPTVVCTNAPAAALLIAPHAPAAAAVLASVRIAPLVTVTTFFEPHPSDLHGFGMLFPAGAGIHALGVLWPSDIFAGRGPARAETWIVGDREMGMTGWDDDRLLAALARDRRLVAGRDARPLASHITRWPEAIPVYNGQIVRAAEQQSALPSWLALAGNYLGKIGVAALLEQAEQAANRVRQSAL